MNLISKAAIRAIAYHLPEGRLTNDELAAQFPEWPADKIEAKLGVKNRPIAAADECSSDLAYQAAIKLFDKVELDRQQIDYVILCTQTPDYLLPTTACLLQQRLGLSKRCGAIDINLGCSGYVYGLGLAKGLIESGQARRVLFLTGETYSKLLHPSDKSTRTLFGDAGSATLIEATDSCDERIGPFVYGSDGSGGDHLIVRRGGFRQPGLPVDADTGLLMNGGEIFAFSVREVSKAVQSLLTLSGLQIDDVKQFVFHQANSHMLGFLRQKCGIAADKFVMDFEGTGNTVSNTIPIALGNLMDSHQVQTGDKIMLVGFGVGLSWGACMISL